MYSQCKCAETIFAINNDLILQMSRAENVDELLDEDKAVVERRNRLLRTKAACEMALEKLRTAPLPSVNVHRKRAGGGQSQQTGRQHRSQSASQFTSSNTPGHSVDKFRVPPVPPKSAAFIGRIPDHHNIPNETTRAAIGDVSLAASTKRQLQSIPRSKTQQDIISTAINKHITSETRSQFHI
jgi:hypothetical protein